MAGTRGNVKVIVVTKNGDHTLESGWIPMSDARAALKTIGDATNKTHPQWIDLDWLSAPGSLVAAAYITPSSG